MAESFLQNAQLTGLDRQARRTEILRAKNSNALDTRVTTLETLTDTTAWTSATLLNSWTAVGSNGIDYRKVGDMVHVRGAATGGTYSGGASTMFTLPSGFRPTEQFAVVVLGEGPVGWTAVEFQLDGDVVVTTYYSGTSQSYIYLPTILFSVTA